jgi:hypothetical protein
MDGGLARLICRMILSGKARVGRALTATARALKASRVAQVAELVDALVSGTSGESRGGSSPLLGTNARTIPCPSVNTRAMRRYSQQRAGPRRRLVP